MLLSCSGLLNSAKNIYIAVLKTESTWDLWPGEVFTSLGFPHDLQQQQQTVNEEKSCCALWLKVGLDDWMSNLRNWTEDAKKQDLDCFPLWSRSRQRWCWDFRWSWPYVCSLWVTYVFWTRALTWICNVATVALSWNGGRSQQQTAICIRTRKWGS
jgi:hypothetical protein